MRTLRLQLLGVIVLCTAAACPRKPNAPGDRGGTGGATGVRATLDGFYIGMPKAEAIALAKKKGHPGTGGSAPVLLGSTKITLSMDFDHDRLHALGGRLWIQPATRTLGSVGLKKALAAYMGSAGRCGAEGKGHAATGPSESCTWESSSVRARLTKFVHWPPGRDRPLATFKLSVMSK